MTRNHDALSPTLGWFSRLRAASGAAWRRFGAWGANLVAALRDPPTSVAGGLRARIARARLPSSAAVKSPSAQGRQTNDEELSRDSTACN